MDHILAEYSTPATDMCACIVSYVAHILAEYSFLTPATVLVLSYADYIFGRIFIYNPCGCIELIDHVLAKS